MSPEVLNSKGGINTSKYLAYLALNSSATDIWNMDIDRCIVVKDFEADVTGVMQYIDHDFKSEIGERTVKINHIDGCGMVLPEVSKINFMVRGPFLKGLLSPFDFIKFCQVNNCPAVIEDMWGTPHDLLEENIQVIFTESQLKLGKYYDSWDHYKKCFKENNCRLCATNYEQSYIKHSEINYQMIQTLTDFTDEELIAFTSKSHKNLVELTENKEAMLKALGAEEDSDNYFNRCVFIYPDLLREIYSKETLTALKNKLLNNGRSAKIKCDNKRLFLIPDLYAACQYWFLGDESPVGLLKDGEVACSEYINNNEVDVLRSPHLFMEHAIRKVSHDKQVYEWFITKGIYTSCHDLISRILQFDCDGDQANVVADKTIISVAKRNIEKYGIVPLFYDAIKANSEIVNNESLFNALKRAHDFSGIGQVSNSLTKLWNKNKPDIEVAAWLTKYNNCVIDAAKTGKIEGYDRFPDKLKRVNSATGGKRGRMPYFFQYTVNKRFMLSNFSKADIARFFSKPNKSTMNRLCKIYDDIGNINFIKAGLKHFNWQMLILKEEYSSPLNQNAIVDFCKIYDDLSSIWLDPVNGFGNSEDAYDFLTREEFCIQDGIKYLFEQYNSLESIYSSIVKYLFTGDNENKIRYKNLFWKIFGEIAYNRISSNINNCNTCEICGIKYPNWATHAECKKNVFKCIDCGKIVKRSSPKQCRCAECQEIFRKIYKRNHESRRYNR